MEVNKIIQGDCLEILKTFPDESVDMICTDPPYGIGFVSNHRKIKYDKIENDNNLDWLLMFVKESYRVAKNNTAHYIFCSFHNIDIFKFAFGKKFDVKNILVWVKNNTSMGDLTGNFASKTEFILFIQKGRRFINGSRDSNVLEFKRTGNKHHPTEKPVDLLKYLINKFSNKGDVILDPFMGSGSTLVAAKEISRNYIGIEINSEYIKMAEERLARILL